MILPRFIYSLGTAALLLLPTAALADGDSGGNANWQNQSGDNSAQSHRHNRNPRRGGSRPDGAQSNSAQDANGDQSGRYGDAGRGYGRNSNTDADDNGTSNRGYNGNGGYNGNYNGRGRNARLSGVVDSFSPFNLQLADGTHVSLHQGTVINPTGTTLQPGMRVTITGNRNSDGSFNANQVDVRAGYNGAYNSTYNANNPAPRGFSDILGRLGL